MQPLPPECRVQCCMSCEKLLNDPIHGYVPLEQELLAFIDTPQFQRLRHIHQLGPTYYVFPGATHKRFEHSIGTAHLAGQLLSHVQRKQPDLDLRHRDVLLVKIAALCHDLGHGPFSHLFDGKFLPEAFRRSGVGRKWCHEEGSMMLMDRIIDEFAIDVDSSEHRALHRMIHPKMFDSDVYADEVLSPPLRRKFLYDVVSNSRNGVDVDKFDYLARDCYTIGLKLSYDSSRLIQNCRVLDDEMCFRSQVVYDIYEMFHTRYTMHKRVYTHRVTSALELMITDILLEADPVLKLSESVFDPEKFLKLTDNVIEHIDIIEHPDLKKAKELIKRIKTRKLYKMASEALLTAPLDKVRKVTEVDVTSHQVGSTILSPEDIVVQNFKIDYSMSHQNPVDSVNFFHSKNPTEKFKIPKHKVSYVTPDQFHESYVRVFCKDPTPEKLQAANEALRCYLRKNFSSSPSPVGHVQQDSKSEH